MRVDLSYRLLCHLRRFRLGTCLWLLVVCTCVLTQSRNFVGCLVTNINGLSLVQTSGKTTAPVFLGSVIPVETPEISAAALQEWARTIQFLLPQSPSAYRFLAMSRALAGQTAEARSLLEIAYRLYPRDILVNAQLGWLHWLDGRHDEAHMHFSQAPGVEILLAHQARAWASVESTRAVSIRLYQSIVALSPQIAEIYYDYADLLSNQKRLEDALALYEQGKQYEGLPLSYYERRANLWLRNKRPDMALNDYWDLVALAPQVARYWYRLGDLLRDQEQYTEALYAYDNGRLRDKDTALFHMRRGAVYVRMGRVQDAVAEMQIAIDVEPTNLQPYLELGVVLRDYVQDREKALAIFQQAYQLAPNEMWPSLGIGETYRAMGDYDQAETWFAQARRLAPTAAEPVYFLGLNHLARRDFAGAVSFLEAAVALQPNQENYHRSLGEAYAGLARWEAAIETYRKLLLLNPSADYARSRISEWLVQQQKGQ